MKNTNQMQTLKNNILFYHKKENQSESFLTKTTPLIFNGKVSDLTCVNTHSVCYWKPRCFEKLVFRIAVFPSPFLVRSDANTRFLLSTIGTSRFARECWHKLFVNDLWEYIIVSHCSSRDDNVNLWMVHTYIIF